MLKRKVTFLGLFIALPLFASASASASASPSAVGAAEKPANVAGVSLRFVSRFTSGAGLGGAEISAMDAKSKRIFSVNGAQNTVNINLTRYGFGMAP